MYIDPILISWFLNYTSFGLLKNVLQIVIYCNCAIHLFDVLPLFFFIVLYSAMGHLRCKLCFIKAGLLHFTIIITNFT